MPRQSVVLTDFSGGLDLVTNRAAMNPATTPNAHNVRLADGGGIESIPGFTQFAVNDWTPPSGSTGSPQGPFIDLVSYLDYYSDPKGAPRVLGFTAYGPMSLVPVGSDGSYTDADGNVAASSLPGAFIVAGASANFTGTGPVTNWSFAQDGDKILCLPDYSSAGGTPVLTSFDANSNPLSYSSSPPSGEDGGPRPGILLGMWSGRMWVSPRSSVWGTYADKLTIEFSEIGNYDGSQGTGSWPVDNTITLEVKPGDQEIVGGIPTPGGLLVFTKRRTVLITDPETGANRVIDDRRGCLSRRSIVSHDGLVYGVCHEGVFVTDGSFPSKIISKRVDDLFLQENPGLDEAVAVIHRGRLLVSFPRTQYDNWHSPGTLTSNDTLTLEFGLSDGYPVLTSSLRMRLAVSVPMGYLASDGTRRDTFTAKARDRLLFIDSYDAQTLMIAEEGGTFNGTSFDWYYDLPPLDLGDPVNLKRLRRLRLLGRGTVTARIAPDFSTSAGDQRTFTFSAPGSSEREFDQWLRVQAKKGRYVQIRLAGTSSGSGVDARPQLDGAAAPDPYAGDTASVGVDAVSAIGIEFDTLNRRRPA